MPADPAMTQLEERPLSDGSVPPYLARPTASPLDALDEALAPGVPPGGEPMTATTRKPAPRRTPLVKLPPGSHGGVAIDEPIHPAGMEWTDVDAQWSPIGAALAKETVSKQE